MQKLILSYQWKLAMAKSAPQMNYSTASLYIQSPEKIITFKMQACWVHLSRTKGYQGQRMWLHPPMIHQCFVHGYVLNEYLLNEYDPHPQSTFYVEQQDPEGPSENTWYSDSMIQLHLLNYNFPKELCPSFWESCLQDHWKYTSSSSSRVNEEEDNSQRNISGK